eukprot:TRINITY_DN73873_c0_g1_i1.p1 TRINITY_DN73873_c0_g1~~TRINITY_DN73873_c0_g1_i1.p1  ORF type:complete len:324 (+),score=50.34 TRINITY_DN73873_c0_g1_i1:65-973(+)
MAGLASPTPSNNLYFQNLPPDMTEETLTQILAAVGFTVAQAKVLPNNTPAGMGTCVALLRFESTQEAQTVLENFNGVSLPGFEKPLEIRFAGKPPVTAAQPAALPFGALGALGGYGKSPMAAMLGQQVASSPYGRLPSVPGNTGNAVRKPSSSDNLYIKGLPPTSDESFVGQLFGQYGTVRATKVLRRNPGDACHALVRFSSVEEAVMVKSQLDGGVLEGFSTPLEIGFAIEKTLANLGGPARGMPAAGGYGGSDGTGPFDDETERMLDEWVKAKRTRDFATADSIRAVLRAQGIDPDTVRR